MEQAKPVPFMARIPGDLFNWLHERSKVEHRSMNLILVDAIAADRDAKEGTESTIKATLDSLRQAIKNEPDTRWESFLTIMEYLLTRASRYNPILRIAPQGSGKWSDMAGSLAMSLVVNDSKAEVYQETATKRKSVSKSTQTPKRQRKHRPGRSQQ